MLIYFKRFNESRFFNNKKKYITSRVLKKNYIILLLSGGHGFKILKNCQFLEVKQGPYMLEKDKERFNFEKNNFIPVNTPLLNSPEKRNILECLKTNQLTSGKFIKKFENSFANFTQKNMV